MTHPMTVDLATPTDMVLVRDFNAPRDLVWACWTDPAHLAAWWGPEGMHNEIDMDFRPGGRQVITMIDRDGNRYPVTAQYREIVAGEKIVSTLTVADNPGDFHAVFAAHAGENSDGIIRIVMTVFFEDTRDGRTRVTVRQTFPAQSERDANMKMGAEPGWRESFVKLDRHLVALSA